MRKERGEEVMDELVEVKNEIESRFYMSVLESDPCRQARSVLENYRD